MTTMRFLPALFALFLILAPPAWGQPVTWQELTNTQYSESAAICGKPGALPAPNCVPPSFSQGSSSQYAIDAWVDGDYAPSLGMFIVPRGGGHADGKGNQVVGFNLGLLKWELLTPPSLNGPTLTGSMLEPRAIYADGTPSSVHSYGALAWMDWLTKMWSAGGIYYSPGGESSPHRTWWWDALAPQTPTSAWALKQTRPCGYGVYAVSDELRQRILFRCSAGMYAYTPAADPGPAPETTLATDFLVGQTTLMVTSTSGFPLPTSAFPTAGVFRVKLSNSLGTVFRVTSVAGNVFTGVAETGIQNALVGTNGIRVTLELPAGAPSAYTMIYSQPIVGESARALNAATGEVYSVSAQAGGGLAVQRGNVTPGLPVAAAKEVTLVTAGGPPSTSGMALLWDAGRLWTLGPAPVAGRSTLWSISPANCGGAAPQAPCQWVQHLASDGVYSLAADTAHGTWRKLFRHGCHFYHVAGGAKNVWKATPPGPTDTCGAPPPPPTATLTLTSTGSTGAGTLTGSGDYLLGAVAAVAAAPEAGSAAGPVTGDAGCQLGAVTMNASKTCNIPLLDVQPPAVGVVSPTPNQLVKAPVPVTVLVTDNRPGVTTTVLLDDHPFSEPTINPAELAEGFHTLVVVGTDAAGLATPVSVPFVTVQCPVCPVATETLTVAKAGTGAGTVTGGGIYAVGAPVTAVSAQPAAGSALTGIAPALCAQKPSFPMPATPLTCTASFELLPPPVPIPPGTAPVAGLQRRTWKGIPAGPMGWTHKHTRLIHDSKRGLMVLAGGDGTGPEGDSFTGQNVFSINLALSATWTKLHGYCPPAGGQMPARPDDMTWGYDPKRDVGVAMPAYYGGAGSATACPGFVWDTLKLPYTFHFDSNQWQRSSLPTPAGGWGGDLHTHYGVLDPTTDAVYRFHYACGVQIIPLDGSAGACVALTFPAGTPVVSNANNLNNDQPAIDVAGRAIYAISRPLRALVKWSITERKVVELIPLPATWVAPSGEFGGWEYETYLAFDSKNRVLMNPNTVGYGGTMINSTSGVNRGVNFYWVDKPRNADGSTKTWEWEAAPAAVSGNALGYDATNNVFLFLGRSATRQQWLYRVE
jgi:hypothetical protein